MNNQTNVVKAYQFIRFVDKKIGYSQNVSIEHLGGPPISADELQRLLNGLLEDVDEYFGMGDDEEETEIDGQRFKITLESNEEDEAFDAQDWREDPEPEASETKEG